MKKKDVEDFLEDLSLIEERLLEEMRIVLEKKIECHELLSSFPNGDIDFRRKGDSSVVSSGIGWRKKLDDS